MDVMPETKYDMMSSLWICSGEAVAWEGVLKYGVLKEYKKNEIIIQAGQTLEALAYLKNGVVKTVATEESGLEKIIWFIEAGGVMGETPLFNKKPCAYYFQAVQDCQVYWFSKAVLFTVILVKHPEIAKSLLTIMARKVHVLSTQVEDQFFLKSMARVAKLIYLFYRGNNEPSSKEHHLLHVTQEDIASLLGLHRVTVNQALQIMRSNGIIEVKKHRIIVLDLELLKNAANAEVSNEGS